MPYDLIADMDDINPEFPTTDVSLVIGANDVVNPVAKTDPASPIYGMPILDVVNSKNTIVIKRGKGTGFAGIENALFYADNTRMLYGDAAGGGQPAGGRAQVGRRRALTRARGPAARRASAPEAPGQHQGQRGEADVPAAGRVPREFAPSTQALGRFQRAQAQRLAIWVAAIIQ